MKSYKLCRNNSGQILTSVIVFMAFGLSVIALSAVLMIINVQNSMKYSESARSLNYAEAGVEEAVIRLARDPAYTGGTLALDSETVLIQLADVAGNKTITATSTHNGFTKKILVTASLANSKVSLISWKEII